MSSSRALLAAALLSVCIAPVIHAQAPAPAQPLSSIPYSPSLDLTSLDRSADPCNDFYKFSCGGWRKNNPIPPDQASWSVYAKLAIENQQFLWGILKDDAVATNRTPVQQKVGDFFAACMNTTAIDALGAKPLQPGLARIDALQTRAQLEQAIATLHHDFAGSFFFSTGAGQDAVDSTTEIVQLGAGGLGLPDRDYYLKTDPKSVDLRAKYVLFIQRMLVLAGEPQDRAVAESNQILTIETDLAKASLTRVDRRDPHKIYHMMSLAELTQLTPAIDWPVYFKTQGIAPVARLNVSQPEFIKAVQSELSTEPLDALRAYLRFHLLTAAAPYLSQPFVQANFDFYSKTLRGIPSLPPTLEDLHPGCRPHARRSPRPGVRPQNLLSGNEGQDPAHDRADRSRHEAGDRRP